LQCINKLKAGYGEDGTIVFNSRYASKELEGFEFDCRKCLPCRLNQAREKAIRCFHEASMHDHNIFLTLTYNDDNLSERLDYRDFQLFMKRLRDSVHRGKTGRKVSESEYMPMMVTGEYGELTKRPHWHALIFNYWPKDAKEHYVSDNKDQVWRSDFLEKKWGKGHIEFGTVTMDSANYVARYAAKKLGHGHDEEHDYHPIHKTSTRYGLGRSWIEKYWKHTFENGFVVLPNGSQAKIPRYYRDWCKREKPDVYSKYITTVAPAITERAQEKARKEELEYLSALISYKGDVGCYPKNRSQVKETILKTKFKRLQEYLKL
jgi:hypothetical protein